MSTRAIYNANSEGAFKAKKTAGKLKEVLLKVANALAFDGDEIAKSKEWPFLWSGKQTDNRQSKAETE